MAKVGWRPAAHITQAGGISELAKQLPLGGGKEAAVSPTPCTSVAENAGGGNPVPETRAGEEPISHQHFTQASHRGCWSRRSPLPCAGWEARSSLLR